MSDFPSFTLYAVRRGACAHYLNLSPKQAMSYDMPNVGVLRLSMGTEALFGG